MQEENKLKVGTLFQNMRYAIMFTYLNNNGPNGSKYIEPNEAKFFFLYKIGERDKFMRGKLLYFLGSDGKSYYEFEHYIIGNCKSEKLKILNQKGIE